MRQITMIAMAHTIAALLMAMAAFRTGNWVAEANGFAVADGSTYFAALATAEDFGCVRHEEA